VSGLPAATAALVGELPAVDLATLEADAELAVRTDRKHLLGWPDVARLLEALAPTHRALEIAGRRSFAYDTTYFDTDELHCFRAHVQGRRRRYKCRTRLYADTDVCALEVKLRGSGASTPPVARSWVTASAMSRRWRPRFAAVTHASRSLATASAARWTSTSPTPGAVRSRQGS
jgi:hypothetical protein